MNKDWLDFLTSHHGTVSEFGDIQSPDPNALNNTISALSNLAILKITGDDASQFLQGQLTCNINDLNEKNSFFSAFCNAKGRVITSLLILKNNNDFLIVLPKRLLDKVCKKLQMYILRSDVQINDMSDTFCLLGINTESNHETVDFTVDNSDAITLKLPGHHSRLLVIVASTQANIFWSKQIQEQNLTPCSSTIWDYQDISAGIPWLSQESSEQYIPQMLNIDKLGGISFNKGCYTGQEIVARTHYLGKSKRELFLAECDRSANIALGTQLLSDESSPSTAKILSIQSNINYHRFLLVMPSADAELKNLTLNNENQDKINIINFQ